MAHRFYTLSSEAEDLWSVIDTVTRAPAQVQDRVLAGMSRAAAADALDLLEMIGHLRGKEQSVATRKGTQIRAGSLHEAHE